MLRIDASSDHTVVPPQAETVIWDHPSVPRSLWRKAKLSPERGAVQEHSSAPSRYHKSLFYSAAVRRGALKHPGA